MAGSPSELAQEPVDPGHDRLAIRTPLLVGPDRAQLRWVQVLQAGPDLCHGEVVIAGDREGSTDPHGASCQVGAADQAIDGLASPGPRRRRVELLTATAQKPVDVAQKLVGLLPSPLQEQCGQLVGIGAGDPPALDSFLQCLLDPLTAQDDESQRFEDALDQLLGQPGQAGRRP